MKTCIYFYILFAVVKLGKTDSLENFVRVKLANYSTWLRANDFDPSPLVSGPNRFTASSSVVNLDCYLRNHGVQGLSGELDIYQVYPSLENKRFSVNFYTYGNITFFGDYTANGTILSVHPLRGNGTWSISVPKLNTFSFNIYFDEGPDGYLRVTDRYFYNVRLNDGEIGQVFFDGLLDQASAIGYEEYIQEALFKGLNEYMDSTGSGQHDQPVRSLFLLYWQQVLAETTMDDILGTTVPPTITTPETPLLSTTTATTETPCERKMNFEADEHFAYFNGKAHKLVETVVEKESLVDENGVKVTFTKTIFITKENTVKMN